MNSKPVYPKDYQPDHCVEGSANYIKLNPNNISGFTTGDGSFAMTSNLDWPKFGVITYGVTQHANNRLLLESFPSVLGVKRLNLSRSGRVGLLLQVRNTPE